LKSTTFHYNYDLDRNKFKITIWLDGFLTKCTRRSNNSNPNKINIKFSYLKIILFAIPRFNRSQVSIRFTCSRLFVDSMITDKIIEIKQCSVDQIIY